MKKLLILTLLLGFIAVACSPNAPVHTATEKNPVPTAPEKNPVRAASTDPNQCNVGEYRWNDVTTCDLLHAVLAQKTAGVTCDNRSTWPVTFNGSTTWSCQEQEIRNKYRDNTGQYIFSVNK